MSTGVVSDPSSLEANTYNGLQRRRRLPVVEGQSARCPLCNRVMILLMLRRGPGFRCGCKDREG